MLKQTVDHGIKCNTETRYLEDISPPASYHSVRYLWDLSGKIVGKVGYLNDVIVTSGVIRKHRPVM